MDRAILRLGACELLHRKNLPAPVVISEAIRLAERFSSAGFPPVCQRRACRHRQNGASLLTHIPSRLMAGFFKKLLTKFSRGTRIDWDELEADLVTADIGIRRAMNIVDQLRESRGLDAEKPGGIHP